MIRKSTAFAGTATAVSHGRPKSFFRAPWGLLLVVLYHLARAHVGGAGILAGVSARPPLPQKIPALIEPNFDLADSIPIGIGQARGGMFALQLVFLGYKVVDLIDDLVVLHPVSFPIGVPLVTSARGASTA